MEAAQGMDIISSHFTEPDFDDQLTAVALFGPQAHWLTSRLPLALRARD